MHRVRRCCALLLLLAGCRSEAAEPPSDRALSSARTSGAGARLVLEDSVQLEETDSTYIGRATGLAVDGTGEIFVADDFSARVLEFTPTGHFVRAYGRKGSGPGELQRPIAIVLLGDSAFAVFQLKRYGSCPGGATAWMKRSSRVVMSARNARPF